MLEFYPLPTNLSHGASLYGQPQNLGGARFLDNPVTTVTTQNHNNNNNINHITACCSLTVPVTISQQQQQQQQHHHHHQQQQQQQQMIASPNQAACPPQQNNVTSVSTCLTAALTAQTTLHAHHTHNQNAISAASSGCVGVGVDSIVTNINPLINSNAHNNSNSNSNRNCSTPLPLTINSGCTSALNLSGILGNVNNNTNNTINTAMHSSNLSQNNSNNNNNNNNNNNSKNNLLNTCPVNNKLTIPTITITTAGTTKATASPSSTTTATITTTATSPSTLTTSILSSTKLVTECNGRTEVIDQIKSEKNCEVCEGCGHKIHDRYLMNVGDTNWHENCLACCFCGLQLYQTCYVRNGKLYCKMDYDRLFGYKCAACCHTVFPHDMVMRPLANLIFHLPCFVCVACRLPLLKGEQFMLREGQILCFRHDLEKELYFAAAHQCNYLGLDEDDMMMRPRDGRRGPKRPRTILTSQQRKQFKLSFEQSPKPCRKVREALAKDTGLSVRVVQVWFQNQRAKMKKIQRKAKNNNNNNNNLENKDKDKEGNKNDTNDSLGGGSRGEHTENSYLSLDNNYATRPLNPNVPFSPDDYQNNSNDSFCSSDLSLDGSNFDHLDDDADSLSLNNLELQSTGSSGHHHSHHHHSHHHHSTPHDILANLNSNLTNPIDKLYLMQNSYFQGDS